MVPIDSQTSASPSNISFPEKHSARLHGRLSILDDLYTTQNRGEERRRIPNKGAKWKIRGDYRGSGALTFGRNSQGWTRGWLTCVQTMKEELPCTCTNNQSRLLQHFPDNRP